MLYLLVFLTVSIQADNAIREKYTQSAESAMSGINSHLYNLGAAINNINLPLVGKLGEILPFAVTSFCLQQFPGQTMLVVVGMLLYRMYHSERVYKLLHKYNFMEIIKAKKAVRTQLKEIVLEDDFFVFDGDDFLDAEEEEDLEDELLNEKEPKQRRVMTNI